MCFAKGRKKLTSRVTSTKCVEKNKNKKRKEISLYRYRIQIRNDERSEEKTQMSYFRLRTKLLLFSIWHWPLNPFARKIPTFSVHWQLIQYILQNVCVCVCTSLIHSCVCVLFLLLFFFCSFIVVIVAWIKHVFLTHSRGQCLFDAVLWEWKQLSSWLF